MSGHELRRARAVRPRAGFGAGAICCVAICCVPVSGACDVAASERSSAAGDPARPAEDPATASATRLRLLCVDEEARPVHPTSAEILCVTWGGTERLPLTVEGDRVTIPLDVARLREVWSNHDRATHYAYLYVRAEGYAAIRSCKFRWVGQTHFGKEVTPALEALRFLDGTELPIAAGQEREDVLIFRRPQPRRLRLVDEGGAPLVGARVRSRMFWSRNNHCGFLAGADPLDDARTDADGVVELTDGEFEVVLTFETGNAVLSAATSPGRWWELVTTLVDEETLVEFRRLEQRPLRLTVLEDGRPLANRVLFSRLVYGCGANWGPLARTDEEGRIEVIDFPHEKYGSIYFLSENENESERIWSEDPSHECFLEPVVVDLGGD